MMKFLKSYGLGIALFALFVGSWLIQYLTHDESLAKFWNSTMENWQSEFLQLMTFVILARWLQFKDSPQSRDGSDRMEAKIDELLRKGDSER